MSNRQEFPIQVDRAWYGGAYYYVEAHRRYSKAAPSESCPNISAYRGWIFLESQSQRVISSRMVLTDCDFKEAGSTVPLGLLELPGGVFAIVENSGWESQAYGIVKLNPTALTQVIDSPVR